jgi:hypothetical protein
VSQEIVISRAHRDALYGSFLLLLGQFRDLETFGASSEPEAISSCERAGERLTGMLRLIQEGGLGWGYPAGGDLVTMTLPPGELRRIVGEQRRLFARAHEALRSDREQTEADWKLTEEARAACTAVLEQIPQGLDP